MRSTGSSQTEDGSQLLSQSGDMKPVGLAGERDWVDKVFSLKNCVKEV